MKILLVGEYNRAHRNIKKGLEILGHDATVVGFRDGFKKVKVDHELKDKFENGFLKKLRVLLVKLFDYDLLGVSLQSQIRKANFSNYDIIQFINEAPFLSNRKSQLKLIKYLVSKNKNVFLLSCGTDYYSVSYAYKKKFRYSILTPYFDRKGSKKDFSPALNYISKEHKVISQFLFHHIEGVIANDIDYHIPLLKHPKYLGMIPHAIDYSILKYEVPNIKGKINILHGINTNNYFKKGNDIFDEALKIITLKYADKVNIVVIKDKPYREYIHYLDNIHILLDQVYAYDQGYNALEAMAKGLVVFTGAEKEWLDYYKLKEDTVAINALPDAEAIASKIEWLILNPEKIVEISKNAREFVEREHNYIEMAQRYLDVWSQ